MNEVDCAACHADPHQGRFAARGARPAPAGCLACHGTRAFRPSTATVAAHAQFGFPLEGGHRATPCSACHKELAPAAGRRSSPRWCARAAGGANSGSRRRRVRRVPHQPARHPVRRVERQGWLRGLPFGGDLRAGRRSSTTTLDASFPLKGAHEKVAVRPVPCARPEERRSARAGLPPALRALRELPRQGGPMKRLILLLALLLAGPLAAQQRTTSPHGDLKLDCTVCHQSNSWTSIQVSKQFDHGRYGFPLTGAHGATTCRACHVSLDFKQAPASCASCHTDNHHGEFGANCARCHNDAHLRRPRCDGQGAPAHPLPADGQPPGRRLHRVPQADREGPDAVRGHADHLRLVPSGGLQHRAEPRGLALPDHVRGMPQHRDLDGGRHGREPSRRRRSR